MGTNTPTKENKVRGRAGQPRGGRESAPPAPARARNPPRPGCPAARPGDGDQPARAGSPLLLHSPPPGSRTARRPGGAGGAHVPARGARRGSPGPDAGRGDPERLGRSSRRGLRGAAAGDVPCTPLPHTAGAEEERAEATARRGASPAARPRLCPAGIVCAARAPSPAPRPRHTPSPRRAAPAPLSRRPRARRAAHQVQDARRREARDSAARTGGAHSAEGRVLLIHFPLAPPGRAAGGGDGLGDRPGRPRGRTDGPTARGCPVTHRLAGRCRRSRSPAARCPGGRAAASRRRRPPPRRPPPTGPRPPRQQRRQRRRLRWRPARTRSRRRPPRRPRRRGRRCRRRGRPRCRRRC